MNFKDPSPFPYEMYVTLGRTKYYQGTPSAAHPSTSIYMPLDPHYLAWPELALHPAEKVNVWKDSTLDAITAACFESPSTDPVEAIFGAKRRFISRSVEDVLGLIYEREQIKYDLFSRIDQESCTTNERLLELETWRAGTNSNADKVRNAVERQLAALEQEKRAEEVACWRDITRLHTDLREMMGEWSQESQRENLLSDLK